MCLFLFIRIRRPPLSTRNDTLITYTSVFRSPERRALARAPALQPYLALRPEHAWFFPHRALASAGRANGRAWLAASGTAPPQSAHECSGRSEEHTSELQSLMRNSYAVFCLKKKNYNHNATNTLHITKLT